MKSLELVKVSFVCSTKCAMIIIVHIHTSRSGTVTEVFCKVTAEDPDLCHNKIQHET
jgi:hypothetical protein